MCQNNNLNFWIHFMIFLGPLQSDSRKSPPQAPFQMGEFLLPPPKKKLLFFPAPSLDEKTLM